MQPKHARKSPKDIDNKTSGFCTPTEKQRTHTSIIDMKEIEWDLLSGNTLSLSVLFFPLENKGREQKVET